jgi:hypothetical protein
MSIQREAADGRYFAITRVQHTALAAAFATRFGNGGLEPVEFSADGRYLEASPAGTAVDRGSRFAATPAQRRRFALRAA